MRVPFFCLLTRRLRDSNWARTTLSRPHMEESIVAKDVWYDPRDGMVPRGWYALFLRNVEANTPHTDK